MTKPRTGQAPPWPMPREEFTRRFMRNFYDPAFEKEKDAIYSAATSNAKDRVKLSFLIQRIAEKEEIKVSQEEIIRMCISIHNDGLKLKDILNWLEEHRKKR